MVQEFDEVEITNKLTVGEGQKNIIIENGKISNRSENTTPITMPDNTLEINSKNILLRPGANSGDLVYIFDKRSAIGIKGYEGQTHLTIYGTEKTENNEMKRHLLLQGDTVCSGIFIVKEGSRFEKELTAMKNIKVVGDITCKGNLYVEEDSRFDKKLTVMKDMTVVGTVATSDVFINSSRELKQAISTLTKDEAYSLLDELEPVKFAFKNDPSKKENIGFIAEDVPDIVSDKDHKQVRYLEIISALTKVVKDLKNEVNELKVYQLR